MKKGTNAQLDTFGQYSIFEFGPEDWNWRKYPKFSRVFMIIFPGKVVDLPVPKPFQSSSGDSESVKIQGDNKSIDTKMLIDTGYVDTGYIVPDQWGPSGPWSHNSHHSPSPSPMTLHHLQHSPSPSPMTLHPSQSYFQFPPPVYNDMSSNDNIKVTFTFCFDFTMYWKL